MEILALDVGLKNTGIARASSMAKLAEPLKTVNTNKVLDELQQIMTRKKVEAIVVGLPRSLAGDDTGQTRWVRQWVSQLKTQINMPFYWQDEALTSHEALAKDQRSKIKDQGFGVDSQAAAIILEDFLSTDKNDRVLV